MCRKHKAKYRIQGRRKQGKGKQVRLEGLGDPIWFDFPETTEEAKKEFTDSRDLFKDKIMGASKGQHTLDEFGLTRFKHHWFVKK